MENTNNVDNSEVNAPILPPKPSKYINCYLLTISNIDCLEL